jgi:hypothetical protein
MKIKIWTNQSADFIQRARRLLQQQRRSQTLPDALIEGERVSFTRLSRLQFQALENTAAQMNLQYDGGQEEAPECPEGYFWNGVQCLRNDNLLRPSLYEQEGF